MEITIKILELEALTVALNNLASALGGKIAQQPVNHQPVQQSAPQQPAQFTPAQVPMQQQQYGQIPTYTPQMQQPPIQNSVPVQPPIQQNPPAQQQVPTSHTAQNFSQDQLAVAMTALCDSGKSASVFGILAQFGAETLMQVPKEQYAALATMLRGAGANI